MTVMTDCLDNHGNPWLAIVVDPLLSLAKSTPEVRAFRVYPAGYTPPKNQTPDGIVVPDVKTAIERWGACWDNYYSLEVSYFMSQLAHNTLNTFRDKFMWMNALTANPLSEPEKQKDLLELISAAKQEVNASGSGGIRQSFAHSSSTSRGGGGGEEGGSESAPHTKPGVSEVGFWGQDKNGILAIVRQRRKKTRISSLWMSD
jgi:COP9 signalosome complex subunit 5